MQPIQRWWRKGWIVLVGIVESDNYYYHGGALSSKTGTAALPLESQASETRVQPIQEW